MQFKRASEEEQISSGTLVETKTAGYIDSNFA